MTGEVEGIIAYVTDSAAFIDKLERSIRGKRRKRLYSPIAAIANLATGGQKRLYARSLHFRSELGENVGELRYGKLKNYRRVPHARVMLRTVDTPLTSAQLCLVEKALLRKNFKAYFSSAEMTFDVSSIDFPFHSVCEQIVAGRRRMRKFRDREGKETLYVGSSNSRWQLRIYAKTGRIVRFEFVFRLNFLRAQSIEQPADLLKLRNIDLLKKVLRPGPLRRLLRNMQKALIW